LCTRGRSWPGKKSILMEHGKKKRVIEPEATSARPAAAVMAAGGKGGKDPKTKKEKKDE